MALHELGDRQSEPGACLDAGRLPQRHLSEGGEPPALTAEWIMGELAGDPSPDDNLGTFSTSSMDREADTLLLEAGRRNYADRGAYPALAEIERRCVHIVADLAHCPAPAGTGTSTVGSSEALYLALAAHRAAWRRRGGHGRANVVAGCAAHTSLYRFAAFFDVDLRLAPYGSNLAVDVEALARLVDERTCAIVAVAGSPETGCLDNVAAIDAVAHAAGVPVHVDAATGGFVLPFSRPELRWDFRLPAVRSLNLSGHKYGLAYPGVAWLLFRDGRDVPEELVHTTPYLAGGPVRDFSLNFTRSGAGVTAQYYAFARLGRAGYRRHVRHALALARRLRNGLEAMGLFRVVSDPALPVVCFAAADGAPMVGALALRLRAAGWVDAHYRPTGTELEVLRVVTRPSMSTATVDRLLACLAPTASLMRAEAG